MTIGKEAAYLVAIAALSAFGLALTWTSWNDRVARDRAVAEVEFQKGRVRTWVDITLVYHGAALNWAGTADNWRAVYLKCDVALDGYRRIFELPTMPHVPPLRPLDAVEAPHKGESP
jgi:hypothetical protein